MKPIYLSFENFGSYREKQEIDFNKLYDSGLFLITGDTGGGKSTILDAMCCALYGCSSGDAAEELTSLRSRYAGEKDETSVCFIFEMHERRYKFERRLVKKRIHFEERYSLTEIRDGVETALLAHPIKTRMNERAREILGLTYQQFSQIIILPQGKFQEFLVSDSNTKAGILSQLFQLQDWDQLMGIMKEQVKQKEIQMDRLKEQIHMILRQAQAGSLEEIQGALVRDAAQIAAQERALAELEAQKREAAAKYEAAIEADKDFAALSAARKLAADLEAMEGTKAQEALQLKRLQELEHLKTDHQMLMQGLAAQQEAEQVLAKKQNALAAQQAVSRQAEQAWQMLDAKSAEMEGHTKRKATLEQATDTYRLWDEVVAEGRKTKAARERIHQQVEREAMRVQEAEQALKNLRESRNQAEASYSAMVDAYLGGISAVLASGLCEGKPCPVCGSLHHPQPAEKTAGTVTDAELKKAETAKTQASQAVQKQEEIEKALRQTLTKAQAEQEGINARYKVLSERAGDLKNRKIQGIDSMEALQREIERETKMLEDHTKRLNEALRQKNDALQLLAKLEGEAGSAQSDAAQKRQAVGENRIAFLRQLAEHGLSSLEEYAQLAPQFDQITAMQNAITAYRTQLQSAKADVLAKEQVVAGKAFPQKSLLEQAKRSTEQAYTDALLKLEALRRDQADRQKQGKELAELIPQQEQEAAAYQELSAFLGNVSPRSGVSLTRFVMGIYFQGIVEEANRQLRKVHGGRYQLQITGETFGRVKNAGLELEVLDSTHPGGRSVKSLSGGEKFLASLCLAIGLTARLQAQEGAAINAMFVDEGFGSLDHASLEDALEVLNVARSGHAGRGLVGIISHVDALKEVIYSRIEVTKDTKGSRLTVRT